ncbi:MAG: 50S ribosomal protein L9 [Bacteroidetes bacterium]|nr:50S ribosomal protein L9 [Bacteroidota bacterium]
MEVILLEDDVRLGLKNDIVSVKTGYARNYLIPQGKAKVANEANRKIYAENMRQQKVKYEKQLEEIKANASNLNDGKLHVATKVGQNDKIFGSITTLQLANAIKDQKDYEIDRRKINIIDDIKTIGTYKASLDLHRDLDPVEITFEVIAE